MSAYSRGRHEKQPELSSLTPALSPLLERVGSTSGPLIELVPAKER